jgi:hypothetical protein
MAGSSGPTAGLSDSPAGREGQLRCRSSADVFTVSDLITSSNASPCAMGPAPRAYGNDPPLRGSRPMHPESQGAYPRALGVGWRLLRGAGPGVAVLPVRGIFPASWVSP